MKKLVTIMVLTLAISGLMFGQVYSDKVVGQKNLALKDSIKSKPYPYALPIWGEKVTAMGYDLPYSAGLGVNYFWQESDILISDLLVGFNNGPMYDISEIVRINSAVSSASSINFRPDIWVFPFLNVYAIIAKANTSTAIGAGVYLPDTTNTWNEIASFSSVAEFQATGVGFGMTPTVGVGGGFLALDMNMSWTDVSALNKPVFTFVFGPRFGKSFKLKKPDRTIAFWAGGFRLHLSSATEGSILLSEVLPIDDLQSKVDDGMQKVEDAEASVDEWWNGLSSEEQKNPVNATKYETADRVIGKTSEVLTSIDGALSNAETASVQYSLTKTPKDMWNFVLGSQFQINKHFMIRAEFGFLGSRQQLITGLQYRFGL